MKLYAPFGNWRGLKCELVARFTQTQVEVPMLTEADLNKKEIKAKSSTGTFPVLELKDGSLFTQSNAICRYFAENAALVSAKDKTSQFKDFQGSTLEEKAMIDSWIEWAQTSLEAPLCAWTYQVFGHLKQDQDVLNEAEKVTKDTLKLMESHLLTNTWLVGKFLSLSDVILAATLLNAFRIVFDEKFRQSFPNVTRWFNTVVNQNPFRDTVGKVFLCQQRQAPSDAAKGAAVRKGSNEKEQQRKGSNEVKQQQPKKEAKKEVKKEEPKKEEPKPTTVPGKAKNPLDLLPETTFVLDDWKREFSNNIGKNINIPATLESFWKQYDSKGWSVWYVEQEMQGTEGKEVYKTMNMCRGFVQRLQGFAKQSFGTWSVYGDEPKLQLSGCFMWRGTEISQEIKDHPSQEFHKWNKLDHTKKADKELINTQWGGRVKDVSRVPFGIQRDGLDFK